MTSGANGEWVRQGTPRDDSTDWNKEQSEYGTAMSPTEWDDYSSEQSVPVAPPRPQPGEGEATAGSPGSPGQPEPEAVPGQEPDASEEYRSDVSNPRPGDAPAGEADSDGIEPVVFEDGSVEDATVDDRDFDDAQMAAMDADDERPIEGDKSLADDVNVDGQLDAMNDEYERPIEGDKSSAADPDPGAQPNLEDTGFVAEGANVEPLVGDDQSAAVNSDTGALDLDADQAPRDVDAEPVSMDTDPEPEMLDVDEESTQQVDAHDMEATQAASFAAVAPAGATAAAATTATGPIPDGLYRAGGSEETAVIAPDAYPDQDIDVEEERLQARLEADRLAREQRLGSVPTSSENAIREDAGAPRVSTDRFFPSLGLFLLRIVTAGILGVASYQILGSGVDATADFLGRYPLIPEPRLVAWILGFTLGAMALLLVIGMLQRVVGFLLLAIAVASLVFIRWGNFSIFNPQVEGFIGDKDLLLAVVGLLILSIGGGAWGIDGAFRRARAESRAERQG